MDLDEILTLLGRYGRYQVLVYFTVCILVFPSVWHTYVMSFIGVTPVHHCAIPSAAGNLSNSTVPWECEDKECSFSECRVYFNFTSKSGNVTSCPDGWIYDKSIFESTIVSEYDLVCEKKVLSSTSQSIFSVGVMVGALVMTNISDRFGRKYVCLGSAWVQAVLGIIVAFSPNFIVFTVMRFLVGCLQEGIGLVAFVIAIELFPPSCRTIPGVFFNLFWASGMMLLGLFAYLIRDWRYLQICISLPSFLTIIYIWIMPESIRWLIARGRFDEAEKVINRAARMNGVTLPDDIFGRSAVKIAMKPLPASDNADEMSASDSPSLSNGHAEVNSRVQLCTDEENESASSQASSSFLSYLRSKTLLTRIAIMGYLWLVNGLAYYGLSLNTAQLPGDAYWNFILSALVEIPANFIVVILLQKLGRKYPTVVMHLIAAAALISTAFIPRKTGSSFVVRSISFTLLFLASGANLEVLINAIAMTGKFAISATYAAVFLYAPEIFPTVARSGAVGFCSFASKLGAIAAPFAKELGEYHYWLPGLLFGSTALIAGGLTMFLPETLNTPLPDTTEDLEKSIQKNKLRKA